MCAFVADVPLTHSHIRFVRLAPMEGDGAGGCGWSWGAPGHAAALQAHVVVMAFNRRGQMQPGEVQVCVATGDGGAEGSG